jgi:hypothetical protein
MNVCSGTKLFPLLVETDIIRIPALDMRSCCCNHCPSGHAQLLLQPLSFSSYASVASSVCGYGDIFKHLHLI